MSHLLEMKREVCMEHGDVQQYAEQHDTTRRTPDVSFHPLVSLVGQHTGMHYKGLEHSLVELFSHKKISP